MKRHSMYALGIAAFALTLAFQNCSGFKANSGNISSQSGGAITPCTVGCNSGGGGGGGVNEKFSAGDNFDAAKLPYVAAGDLVTEAPGYNALTGFKALAMAANGYGFIANHPMFTSDFEASRIALEACQVVAADQACAIVAEGSKFKYTESDLKANRLIKVLETGARSFAAGTVPWQRDAVRAADLTTYASSTATYKALALDIKGAGAFRTSTVSQAEASRRTLEACQAYAKGRPCTLYAEQNTVVFNVVTLNYNTVSNIDFTRTAFDAGFIPWINDASRATLGTEYPAYITGTPGGAMAIHPNGAYAYAANAATALTNCANTGTPTPCVLYAQGLTVVLKKTDLDRAF